MTSTTSLSWWSILSSQGQEITREKHHLRVISPGHRALTIDGHMARGPWASPKHEFLARHEHEPSTMISGLGWHEHNIGLCWATISAHSAGPARHENTQHDAAHVLARGPGAHSAHPAQRIKSATQVSNRPHPHLKGS
jgi:hypothetical protein